MLMLLWSRRFRIQDLVDLMEQFRNQVLTSCLRDGERFHSQDRTFAAFVPRLELFRNLPRFLLRPK